MNFYFRYNKKMEGITRPPHVDIMRGEYTFDGRFWHPLPTVQARSPAQSRREQRDEVEPRQNRTYHDPRIIILEFMRNPQPIYH